MVTSYLIQISLKNDSIQGRWLVKQRLSKPLVVLRIIQVILKSSIIEVIIFIYLSKSFDNVCNKECNIMYVVLLSENDYMLGNLKDILNMCENDYMIGFFTTHSSEIQNHLWYDDLMFMCLMYYKCVYLIICSFMDHFGVPREGCNGWSLFVLIN